MPAETPHMVRNVRAGPGNLTLAVSGNFVGPSNRDCAAHALRARGRGGDAEAAALADALFDPELGEGLEGVDAVAGTDLVPWWRVKGGWP